MRKKLPFLGLSFILIALRLLFAPNLMAENNKSTDLQLRAERTLLQQLNLPKGVFHGNFGIVGISDATHIKATSYISGIYNWSTFYVQRGAEFLIESEYCIPGATNSDRYISNFSTTGGTINISNLDSGFSTGGYGNFYDTHTVEQIAGQSIQFQSNIVGGTAGFRIWVDWNQDGTFDTTEEVAYNSSAYSASHTGVINIPQDALIGETTMRIVSHYLSNVGNVDPCITGFTNGEFEDYKFSIIPMPDCNGIPNAGITSVTPELGNIDSTYTVSTTNYMIANGLTYQWQSNTNGAGWVNEGEATEVYSDFTATANGEAGTEIEWRLAVTCIDSGDTAYSDAATYTITLYCIPGATNSSRYISNFSTTGGSINISNLDSGFSTGGYGNFYDTHTVEQIAGQSIQFQSNIVGGTAGFRIWVDWNQDGVFDTTEEVAYNSSAYSASHTGVINIPEDVLIGETTMRIVSHFSSNVGNVDPCITGFTNGEFEDYKFTIIPMSDCNGIPNAGITSVTPELGNIDSTYTVSTTDYMMATGLTYQWQSNTNGAGWVNEGEATEVYSDFTATANGEVGTEIEWRLAVTCIDSGDTAYSDVATYTITLYCIPGATNSDRYISNFSTTGGTINISNLDSGFSTGGYGNFYDTHTVEQIAGQSIQFESNIVGGTAGFRIWVDWNQDGVFDTTEEVAYNSSAYSASHTGVINIPEDVLIGETTMRIVSHYSSNVGNVDPCITGFTNGEFEDYKFSIIPMPDCNGIPDAGITSVTPELGNPDSTYTVSTTNYMIANGLTYQWQSNTNGAGWVNEGEATEVYSDFTATANGEVGTEIEWRLAVTCIDSGDTAYSDTATFTIEIVYCTPSITYTIEPITRVIFTEIDNSSSASTSSEAYEDFTHIEGNLTQGGTYPITLEGFTNGNYTNHFTVWVDWNQNGTFEQNEMHQIGSITFSTGTDGKQATGEITVPIDATLGATRMRIIKNFSTSPTNPCGPYSYGQTEDYTIIVGELDDCSGTPETGTVSVNPELGNSGSTYTVSATGYSVGNGITYQWQSNTNGAGWVNEGEATEVYSNFIATVSGEAGTEIEWRLAITCIDSGETAYSDPATYTITPYCIPEATNSDRYISNFSTTGGTINISNLDSGFSTGGYGNFYDTHTVEQIAGQSIQFQSNIVGGTAGFRVWVDWNQDGVFDTTEEVAYNSSTYSASHTGVINIPEDALIGETTMRIVSHYLSMVGNVNPCETGFTNGEFEDYKFIVAEGESTSFTCEDNFVPSNGIENGSFFGGDNNERLAVDIIVGDEGFSVYGMELNIFTNGNTDLDFNFTIYEDNEGLPGSIFNENISGTVHSSEYVGNLFFYDIYKYVVTFDAAIALEANSTYWIEVETNGLAWERTTADTFGAQAAYMNDNTLEEWVIDTNEMVYSLICEELSVSDLSSFDFAYYPNPVRDVLNITSQKTVQSVEVYNLTGQKVMVENKVNQDQIDVSKLTAGTYVFRVTLDNGQVETFKIIKK